MMAELRGRLGRLGLVFGGIICGLLCAECGVRLLEPRGNEFVLEAEIGSIPPNLYEPDPELRTRLRANVNLRHRSLEYGTEIRTNSLGIRGPEPAPKASEEIRILTVGDSFTLGIQVEESDTAGAVMAGHLSEAWGREVTAWNAGVDGYGTQQAIELARRLAPRIEADIIFLRFYLGNDLRDNHRWSEGGAGRPPEMLGEPPSETLLGFHRIAAGTSRLYARLLAWRSLRDSSRDPRVLEMGDEVLPYVDPSRLESLLPATRSALSDLASVCEEMSALCVVSWSPPAYAIHTERAPATFDIFGLDATRSDPARLLETVNSVLPRGVISCDPSPSLREASADRDLYFVYDPHWNEDGHRTAGQSDAACLTANIDPDSF